MKRSAFFVVLAILCAGNALASSHESNILARYSNFYRGDDDAFGTCLILQNSTGMIWIDGLVPSSIRTFSVSRAKFHAFEDELKKLPNGTQGVSENVYPENQSIGMIASTFLSAKHAYPGYMKVAKGSKLETVIKSICNMEEKD